MKLLFFAILVSLIPLADAYVYDYGFKRPPKGSRQWVQNDSAPAKNEVKYKKCRRCGAQYPKELNSCTYCWSSGNKASGQKAPGQGRKR